MCLRNVMTSLRLDKSACQVRGSVFNPSSLCENIRYGTNWYEPSYLYVLVFI